MCFIVARCTTGMLLLRLCHNLYGMPHLHVVGKDMREPDEDTLQV